MLRSVFTRFINISLKVLFLFVLGGALFRAFNDTMALSKSNQWTLISVTASMIIFAFIFGFGLYKYLRKNGNIIKALIIILVVAFILRLMWIIFIDSKFFSDFALVYNCGNKFIHGEYYIFKGTSYIARFPHLTIFTIYAGFMHRIFINPVLAIKFVNVLLSTLDVYLIYLITSVLYDNKVKGVWAGFVSCLFPPFIMYSSVFCSENLAIPFFLLSIYAFLLVIKKDMGFKWLILSGVLLSMGNLFRMVGEVIVVAYIMYLLIYLNLRKSIKSSLCIIIAFLIPLLITNAILINLGVTQYPLWRGREPAVTSILKGTNLKSGGKWNKEDAAIPSEYKFNYNRVEKASMAIIKDRLTQTPFPTLLKFYIVKFGSQWSEGDFSGLFWSTARINQRNTAVDLSKYTKLSYQLFYSILILLIIKGLFNKKQYMENIAVNLFYIIFCGYGLLYLITEFQIRYGYIVCWLFIVLAFSGIDKPINTRLGRRLKKFRNTYFEKLM